LLASKDPNAVWPLKACDYFDLIVGTSTGGLIAVMLGPLQMDIDRCIKEYLRLAPIIFPTKNFIAKSKVTKMIKGVQGEALFKAGPMEEEMKKLVAEELGTRATAGADALLCPGGTPPLCKV
jgi:hypothetical protein